MSFSMAAICLPYENRLRRTSWALISSTKSSRSESFSSLSSFSVYQLAVSRSVQEAKLTNHVIAVLVPDQGLRWTFTLVIDYGQGGDDLVPFLF